MVSEILHRHFTEDVRTSADFAILYRGNHQARPFEKALREHNVPYFLSGGTSFFARTEVKDLMAYLRLLANPDDDAAFLRIVNTPRREIGPNTVESLAGYAKRARRQPARRLRRTGPGPAPGRACRSERLQDFAAWIGGYAQRAAVRARRRRARPGRGHELRRLAARGRLQPPRWPSGAWRTSPTSSTGSGR